MVRSAAAEPGERVAGALLVAGVRRVATALLLEAATLGAGEEGADAVEQWHGILLRSGGLPGVPESGVRYARFPAWMRRRGAGEAFHCTRRFLGGYWPVTLVTRRPVRGEISKGSR